MNKVPCNFIMLCSSSAHFCNFSTFKMADFLPVKKNMSIKGAEDTTTVGKQIKNLPQEAVTNDNNLECNIRYCARLNISKYPVSRKKFTNLVGCEIKRAGLIFKACGPYI